MKNWNKLGVALLAVVLAVAVAGGAYAMWGGDDGGSKTEAGRDAGQDEDVAGICLEGDEDCLDTVDDVNGGAAGTCLEGTEDCVDADLGGDGAERCLPEMPDCDDTIGGAAGGTCLEGTEDCVDADLGGGSLGMCAPGVTDCVDVAVEDCAPDAIECGRDVVCDVDGCVVPECVDIEPGQTLTPEEEARLAEACAANGECNDTGSERCLPPDCSVSSDGTVACPQDDPGASGSGGRTEPGSSGSGVDPVAPSDGAPPVSDPAQ